MAQALNLDDSSIGFPVAPGPPPALHDDFSFELKTTPGRIGLRATVQPVPGTPNGWQLKAVRVSGIDVTDTGIGVDARGAGGIEIELTNRRQEMSGVVIDARGDPVKDYAVVLFAQDRGRWVAPFNRYFAIGRPGDDGRFKIGTLPPGNYYAIALDRIDAAQSQDPEFLEGLTRQASTLAHSGRDPDARFEIVHDSIDAGEKATSLAPPPPPPLLPPLHEPAAEAATSASTAAESSAPAAAERSDAARPSAPTAPPTPEPLSPATDTADHHDGEEHEQHGGERSRRVRWRLYLARQRHFRQRHVAAFSNSRNDARRASTEAGAVVAGAEGRRHYEAARLAGEPVGNPLFEVVNLTRPVLAPFIASTMSKPLSLALSPMPLPWFSNSLLAYSRMSP